MLLVLFLHCENKSDIGTWIDLLNCFKYYTSYGWLIDNNISGKNSTLNIISNRLNQLTIYLIKYKGISSYVIKEQHKQLTGSCDTAIPTEITGDSISNILIQLRSFSPESIGSCENSGCK